MEKNAISNAQNLATIGKIADTSFYAGGIDKDQHAEIKKRVRELELDNLFKAMADFCNQ